MISEAHKRGMRIICLLYTSMNVQFFNAMIGVIGGFGAGVAHTFVRKIGKQGERGPVIVMCFSVFSCIVTAPFLLEMCIRDSTIAVRQYVPTM